MTILQKIVAKKREEISKLNDDGISISELKMLVQERGGIRDFYSALRFPRRGNISLIAEIKKSSPSSKTICPNFDPIRIAKKYELYGASCLSVLTDESFFEGSLVYLKQIRHAVNLPLLRKDFIIDARQIRQSIEWGADAILLIMAILNKQEFENLYHLASSIGLSVIVEVRNEKELSEALIVNPKLIGINNRNLDTFDIDIKTTERLSPKVNTRTNETLIISESGLNSRNDVKIVTNAGSHAILVGESLIKCEANIESKINELLENFY